MIVDKIISNSACPNPDFAPLRFLLGNYTVIIKAWHTVKLKIQPCCQRVAVIKDIILVFD